MINYLSKPFKWFFKLEAASGLILLIVAILALFISNSDLSDLYFHILEKYNSARSELLTTNATIAANNNTSPLAASSLKNHLKGFEILFIISI